MLKWVVIFFVVSLIAALFGFTGSSAAADIAKVIFFFFISLFVVAVTLLVTFHADEK